MDEPLFEIENWRGGWYYKFGSRYTGPFPVRSAAIAAATRDLMVPEPSHRTPLPASLARMPAFSDFG
ncbi:hypothetical protein [Hoeflea ulvae]|uniref:Uncharacterized protein n=1 Tax=Hoeflea ulvae TaxID=2983764 RepID=A0ABT3YDP5_9HYPH|nr:hypothetical protein [Hoeflea ulvae]MCY0094014.1 hypothetical protein [Hoeflea ulvae]